MSWEMPVPVPVINSTLLFPSAHVPNSDVLVTYIKHLALAAALDRQSTSISPLNLPARPKGRTLPH